VTENVKDQGLSKYCHLLIIPTIGKLVTEAFAPNLIPVEPGCNTLYEKEFQ
jgi:hypothetical protein